MHVRFFLASLLLAASAQAETKFEILNRINLSLTENDAVLAEAIDFEKDFGDYKGRCYFPENPDEPIGMILSIRPFKDDINGPLFSRSGFSALLISNTGGVLKTDSVLPWEIESIWRNASDTMLDDAEIIVRNKHGKWSTFVTYPKKGVEAGAIMARAKKDGFIYVSAYAGDSVAVQSCYFWEKRSR